MSDDGAGAYMAEVKALIRVDGRLSPLGAGMIAALRLDIAHDSLGFARALGVGHALVLREVELLSSDLGLLDINRRDPRTQRTYYALSVTALALVQPIVRHPPET
jgi:hypothetical protein